MTSPSTQPRVRCHHFHPVPAGLWQHGRQVLLQALRKTPKQRAAASQQHVGEELLPWTKGNYGKTHGKRHAEYMGNQGKINVYIYEKFRMFPMIHGNMSRCLFLERVRLNYQSVGETWGGSKLPWVSPPQRFQLHG